MWRRLVNDVCDLYDASLKTINIHTKITNVISGADPEVSVRGRDRGRGFDRPKVARVEWP